MGSKSNLFGLIIIGTLAIFAISRFAGDVKTETIHNCKVIHLQQQSLMSGSKDNINTDIRYLVVTDKETFICESSIFNGKFNNSDIFFRLKEDSTYNFKVAGIGKSLFMDYRNILEVKK